MKSNNFFWNKFYDKNYRQYNADLNFLTLLYNFNNRKKFYKKKFLVIGAGDGVEAFEIARNKAEVWATDYSTESVKRLKSFNFRSKHKIKKIVLLDQRDLSTLPNNYFDLVVSWSVIGYISKKDALNFFKNIKKKIKKKGRMIILFSNYYRNMKNKTKAIVDNFNRTFYSSNQAKAIFKKNFKVIAETKLIHYLPPKKEIKMSRSLFLLERK